LQNLKNVLKDALKSNRYFFAFDEAQADYKYLKKEHIWKSNLTNEYQCIASPVIRALTRTGPLVTAGTALSLVSIESCKSDIGKEDNTDIVRDFPQITLVESTPKIDALLNMKGVNNWHSLMLKLEGRGRLLGGFFAVLEKADKQWAAGESKIDVLSAAISEHYDRCRDHLVDRIRLGFPKMDEAGLAGQKRLPEPVEMVATAALVGQTVSLTHKKVKLDLLNVGLCSVRVVGNVNEFLLDEELGRDAIERVASSEGYYSESLETVKALCRSTRAVGFAMEPLVVAE